MTKTEQHRIAIPASLNDKLVAFRSALLINTAREGLTRLLLVAAVVLFVVLLLDRFVETPSFIRATLLSVWFAVMIHSGFQLWRATWSCRTLLRTSEHIRRYDPIFGDHLVGAMELSDSVSEQARSHTLCEAALRQVAEEADKHDFHQALPPSRARQMLGMLAVLSLLFLAIGLSVPELLFSGARRLIRPFGSTPRFTFVSLGGLESEWVVPRDEPSTWTVELDGGSRWVPGVAKIRLGSYALKSVLQRQEGPVGSRVMADDTADVEGDISGKARASGPRYTFKLPRLYEPIVATVRIGDASTEVLVVPKLRPQLRRIEATVRLPEYLRDGQSTGESPVEIQGLQLGVVEGGVVSIQVATTASLRRATVDGRVVPVTEDQFSATLSAGATLSELDWVDIDRLRSAAPTKLTIRRVPDQAPTLLVESETIPPRVLDRQAIRFSLEVRDDFAIRRIGMEWATKDERGERVLGNGQREANLSAVFQATAMSVPAGQVAVRFWAEDDLPGRGRVYSDPVTMNVLSGDEHAVWIADQFARWRQAAMDVRDKELSLFARNRELAEAAADERDDQWRAAVAEQARAEDFNGRQLDSLTTEGQALLRQAARNDEVDVDYVEKLAETVQSLEKMAEERMPRVAELLKQASEEEESKFAELIDQETSQGNLPGERKQGDAEETEDDQESSQQERIGLAGTTIVDTSKRKKPETRADESEDKLSIAVEDQTDLVAEFDAVAEELEELLGNMEGSTLVKRLKSVSRRQDRVAMQLSREIETTFGQPDSATNETTESIVADVDDSASRIRTVLDDLEAFCERRDIEHFASVLAEMKAVRVLDQLKTLKERVVDRPGMSIAMAEYWADNLDRWADDLVDPGSEQPESGPQNNQSLPPSVIIEVLRILEGEVDLREHTRVAEQGRTAMTQDKYIAEAIRLSETQDLLRDRLDQVVEEIEGLPNGELNFAGEMEVLDAASAAMVDATKILISPETGPVAIAAQTEAIELLLRSRKIAPEGGGGGAGSAGGGQGGQTDEAAIALLGKGLNELAVTRDSETQLSLGSDRAEVPERWREGLDEYFDQLERRKRESADGGRR